MKDTKSKVVIVEEFKKTLLKPSKLRTRTINEYGFNLKEKPKVFTRTSNRGNKIYFLKKGNFEYQILVKKADGTILRTCNENVYLELIKDEIFDLEDLF